MPVKMTSTPPDLLGLDIDAAATVTELQARFDAHSKRALLAGRKAAGGSLPMNKAGKPLGQGDGSIATQWESSPVSGDRGRAEASSSPGQQGGLFYAVRAMVDADANPASTEGEAGLVIDQVVSRAADRAINV